MNTKNVPDNSSSSDDSRVERNEKEEAESASTVWTSVEKSQPTFTEFINYNNNKRDTSGTSLAYANEQLETVSTQEMRKGNNNDVGSNSEGYFNGQQSAAYYEQIASSSSEPMVGSIIRDDGTATFQGQLISTPVYRTSTQSSSSLHQVANSLGISSQSQIITPGMGGGMECVSGGNMVLQPTKLDISQYPVNKDPCPTVIIKHPDQPVHYEQNITVRCLKPPTPPPAPPVVIQEVRPPAPPAAPPIYIRQPAPRPRTPPPLIIRERPPPPPVIPPPKVIHKVLAPPPPPPRRVIIEKLPPVPPKPRQVIIEKWLPYPQVKRRIIYQRAPDLPPVIPEKNTIIRWTGPQVQIHKRVQHLGVVRADPGQYAAMHGAQLADSHYVHSAMQHYGVRGACEPAHHMQMGSGVGLSGANAVGGATGNVYFEDQQEIMRLMQGGFAHQHGGSIGLEHVHSQDRFNRSDICIAEHDDTMFNTHEPFQDLGCAEWMSAGNTFYDSYFPDPTTYAAFYSNPFPSNIQHKTTLEGIICPDMMMPAANVCQYFDQPGHDPVKCLFCKEMCQ